LHHLLLELNFHLLALFNDLLWVLHSEHIPVDLFLVQIVLRGVTVAAHGLDLALGVGLIALLDLHDLISFLELFSFKILSPVQSWVRAGLASASSEAREATEQVSKHASTHVITLALIGGATGVRKVLGLGNLLSVRSQDTVVASEVGLGSLGSRHKLAPAFGGSVIACVVELAGLTELGLGELLTRRVLQQLVAPLPRELLGLGVVDGLALGPLLKSPAFKESTDQGLDLHQALVHLEHKFTFILVKIFLSLSFRHFVVSDLRLEDLGRIDGLDALLLLPWQLEALLVALIGLSICVDELGLLPHSRIDIFLLGKSFVGGSHFVAALTDLLLLRNFIFRSWLLGGLSSVLPTSVDELLALNEVVLIILIVNS